MANSLSSIIDLVHPSPSGIGIITTGQVYVLFDREIDETTIAGGNFFVTGPDFDTWLGPDLQLFHEAESTGEENEILQSPGFHGIVQGKISFERISLNNLSVVDTQDTIGSGQLYRTKAIFTPTNRLAASTEYNIYLSGDEDDSDSLQTGISERTVFDTVASGANVGTVNPELTGGYIGLAGLDVFHIEITTTGEVGTAKFIFYQDSDPYSIFGPFRTKQSGVLLSDGVVAEFPEGVYQAGDHWHTVVKSRVVFSGNVQWSFKTGSGNISSVPSSTSTSVLGDPTPTVVTTAGEVSTSTFGILSTDPTDGASNLMVPTGDYTITAEFNQDINPSTVVSGVSVSVLPEDVTGDIPYNGEILISNPTVTGNTMSIVVASGQLLQNQLITVLLDKSIESIDGTALEVDTSFSFTTRYSPMYCNLRRMRLAIGLYIKNVADDTINLAIHLASLMADDLTWNKENLDDNYYKFARMSWVCCKAQEILLINTTGGAGSLKSKKLGDLAVEYDTSNTDINTALQQAIECQARWEDVLLAGGRQVQKPKMVVRGELDIDKPPVGRGWHHTRLFHSQTPVGNRRLKFPSSRRYRTLYSRRGRWNK